MPVEYSASADALVWTQFGRIFGRIQYGFGDFTVAYHGPGLAGRQMVRCPLNKQTQFGGRDRVNEHMLIYSMVRHGDRDPKGDMYATLRFVYGLITLVLSLSLFFSLVRRTPTNLALASFSIYFD